MTSGTERVPVSAAPMAVASTTCCRYLRTDRRCVTFLTGPRTAVAGGYIVWWFCDPSRIPHHAYPRVERNVGRHTPSRIVHKKARNARNPSLKCPTFFFKHKKTSFSLPSHCTVLSLSFFSRRAEPRHSARLALQHAQRRAVVGACIRLVELASTKLYFRGTLVLPAVLCDFLVIRSS